MMEFILSATVGLNVAITLYAFHKIRRIHLATFAIRDDIAELRGRHLTDLHQQMQELARLEFRLRLDQPLPPTRGWAASPDFLRHLVDYVRAEKPSTVVELGSGTSTVVLARSLELNGSGHLYSYDHVPEFASQTRATLREYGLSNWATVIDAPLATCEIEGRQWRWYKIPELPRRSIDLLVIDGPPEVTGPLARYPAGAKLFPHLTGGGAVFLDDANRPDERKAVEEWLMRFSDLTVAHLQTEKGCVVLRKPTSGGNARNEMIQEDTQV